MRIITLFAYGGMLNVSQWINFCKFEAMVMPYK